MPCFVSTVLSSANPTEFHIGSGRRTFRVGNEMCCLAIHVISASPTCILWAEAGVFPHDLLEFESRLATDEDCRRYLSPIRCPYGSRCPVCGINKALEAGA